MDLKNTKNKEAKIFSLADEIVSIHVPTLIKDHRYNDAIEGLHTVIALYYEFNKITEIGPLIQKISEIYSLKMQEEINKLEEKDRENIKKDIEDLEKLLEFYPKNAKIQKIDFMLDFLEFQEFKKKRK